MNNNYKKLLSLLFIPVMVMGAGGNGCTSSTPETAVNREQESQNRQMDQFLRTQPVPSFDFSQERYILIKMYIARQKATNTYSFVQSEYTGKVLWSCASIGFPIPFATQLTNPNQLVFKHHPTEHDAAGVVAQQEPNGLFSPSQSDATWIPCVDEKGNITPVYEEKHVTVFLRPMVEQDGRLVPAAGAQPSMSIAPSAR